MALFSSSLMAGLVVVTFCIVGADVVIVTGFGMVMDDTVMMDDGSVLSSGVDISSKTGISVVNVSATLVLGTVSVWCQAGVVNQSSKLDWIAVPTFPGWSLLLNWDSSNSTVGLVTNVKSTSSNPVVILVSGSVLSDAFCRASSITDKVTLALAVWLMMPDGMGVLGSAKNPLGVFVDTLGVVASTLVPVVRIVYSQVLFSVYEMLSGVVLVHVVDGGLVVFTVTLGLLVLTLGVV